MFWNKMNTADIEKLVETAVEKATAKTDERASEERKRTNYLRASQSGQFKTRTGIFEYFRAYEGMDVEEALKMTDLECKGRGIGADGKAPEETHEKGIMEQLQAEVGGYLINSLKSDPIGTITTVGQMAGGALSFGAGLLGGKAVAEATQPAPVTPIPEASGATAEPIAEPLSYEELKARQAAQTETQQSNTPQ